MLLRVSFPRNCRLIDDIGRNIYRAPEKSWEMEKWLIRVLIPLKYLQPVNRPIIKRDFLRLRSIRSMGRIKGKHLMTDEGKSALSSLICLNIRIRMFFSFAWWSCTSPSTSICPLNQIDSKRIYKEIRINNSKILIRIKIRVYVKHNKLIFPLFPLFHWIPQFLDLAS